MQQLAAFDKVNVCVMAVELCGTKANEAIESHSWVFGIAQVRLIASGSVALPSAVGIAESQVQLITCV